MPPRIRHQRSRGHKQCRGHEHRQRSREKLRWLANRIEATKPTDVVFVVAGDRVKAVAVKIGICDDNYWEITDGLTNDQEIVSGGYRAIGRDLQDGSKIHVGPAGTGAKG